LDAVLFDDFEGLRLARTDEDNLIVQFFEQMDENFFDTSLFYTNSLRNTYIELASVAVAHFFNHQTHHRGQVHVMLSQTSVPPPSLDLHRIIKP
jgi:uncharacterized damage-inducible protein DinB